MCKYLKIYIEKITKESKLHFSSACIYVRISQLTLRIKYAFLTFYFLF